VVVALVVILLVLAVLEVEAQEPVGTTMELREQPILAAVAGVCVQVLALRQLAVQAAPVS
jgi:hypothetical protein